MQTQHSVVSRQQWDIARDALLSREKTLTHAMDALARDRLDLPWVQVEKRYQFQSAHGPLGLADLFGAKSQLIIYHFMFDPDWEEGCVGCSFLVDHLDSALTHLRHHDVSVVAVGRAPIAKLEAFKRRMGWKFDWYSSEGCDFNFDMRASVPKADGSIEERSGASAFFRDPDGEIFHTYSAFERGVERLAGAYNYLDFAPLGRNENGPHFNLGDWVRHHDRYDATAAQACSACK
ncbi:thioredoxin family protein [Achromobacter seleniivolatilans]|uniref:Thioredoxin family protein n=1 Tax=Achromobacter seleniivolatilans TaxID=3047478 RepID=A0ABY9M2K2_9BURK|nr:thioredoxin family protein [Achromobacter sp. R39]WMD21247.1 thioredoxin family protein [Achromobacter sp. R39]